MSTFERLLEVQDHDTALDRLRHQRARLPERAELAAVQKRASELEAELRAAVARLEVIEQRQAALESEAAAVGQRVAGIEKRMYSGEVSATRDLLAMTAEIDALNTRRSSFEDDAIAAMEEAEPLAQHIAALEARKRALGAEADQLLATIGVAEAEIDTQAGAETESRGRAAEQVPPDLLMTYEKLRSALGGIGAARMVGTSCSGCHLRLPASEVARLKREPPDALVLCDQCGRILVR